MSAVQKQHVNHPNTWRKAFVGTIDDISAAAQWVDKIAADRKFPQHLVFALQVCLEELLTNVWQYPDGVGDAALVRNHIHNLRRKIEQDPERPLILQSRHGPGYVIKARAQIEDQSRAS